MKDVYGNDIRKVTFDLPILVYKKLQRLSKPFNGSLTDATIDAINKAYEVSDTKTTEARDSDG